MIKRELRTSELANAMIEHLEKVQQLVQEFPLEVPGYSVMAHHIGVGVGQLLKVWARPLRAELLGKRARIQSIKEARYGHTEWQRSEDWWYGKGRGEGD